MTPKDPRGKGTVGYIVIDDVNSPMMLDHEGILCTSGTIVSLLASRRDAQRAIKRAAQYAKPRRLDWGVDRWRIRRVVA